MPFNSNLANIFTTISAITSTTTSNNSSWQNNNITSITSSSSLSLTEFDSLLSTDIYLELETNNDNVVASKTRSNNDNYNSIDDIWDALTRYEWDQQQQHNRHEMPQSQHLRHSSPPKSTTTSSNTTPSFPYITCSKHPQPTSGYTITTNWKQELKQRYNISSEILPLYNKPHMTCFVTSLAHDIASRIATNGDNNWIIHPLAPEMKLSGGIVDNIILHNNDGGTTSAVSLEVLICPGALQSSEKGRKGEEMMIIVQDIISSLGQRSSDDDHDGDDKRRRRRQRRRSLVSERFLRWRLLHHHHDDNNDRNEQQQQKQKQQQQQSSRRQLWDDALQTTLDSSKQNTTSCISNLLDSRLTPSQSGDAIIISPPSFDNTTSTTTTTTTSSSCLLSLLAALTLHPSICLISTIPTLALQNDVAQWIMQTGGRTPQDPIDDGYVNRRPRPWFDVGLTGKGQTIAISDSGLDVNHCYFWDGSGEVRKSRWGAIDHTRRKVIQYVSYADDIDANGHGTHVTATAVGRRTTNGRDELTGKMDGMARDAKVAFFDVERGAAGELTIPYDFDDLFRPGYNAGARIHSASWGGPALEYDFVSRDVDDFSYRNDDFLAIFAAGNQGNDRGPNTMKTINTPALAKNALAVGASQSADDNLDYGMLGFDYLADFSSRGPTPDGRTKPDVVAPGYYITSARPSDTSRPCGSATQRLAGTSFATPIVSGMALLIRQYFTEGWYPSGRPREEHVVENPSGSLVKAVLINGARYLKGVQQGKRRRTVSMVRPYDDNQNYGRVSLIDSLRLAENNDDEERGNGLNVLVYDRQLMRDGEVMEFDIVIGGKKGQGDNDNIMTNEMCGKRSDDSSSGGRELSVTLVWTDPPSYPGCRSCVLNDLDLEITKQQHNNIGQDTTTTTTTTYYYPNGRTSRDDINNVERIRLEQTDLGERYTVRVRGYDLQSQYQIYSLVVAGCFELYKEDEEELVTTPSPTVSPVMDAVMTTPMPSMGRLLPSKTITTSYGGSRREAGNMFDIVARSHILITGMSIHTRVVTGGATTAADNTPLLISIYTKLNSHTNYEQTPWAWTPLVTSHPIIGRGASRPTPLPSSIFQNSHNSRDGGNNNRSSGNSSRRGGGGGIEVRPGERMAFYVTLNVEEMLYGRAWWLRSIIARNGDLDILAGVACEYEFGKVYSPRSWNGALEYVVLD